MATIPPNLPELLIYSSKYLILAKHSNHHLK